MKVSTIVERIVFLVLILLSLTILLLVVSAPPDFLDVNAVYKGF